MRTRFGLVGTALIALSLSAQPVAAMQLGGLFGGRSNDREESQQSNCEEERSSRRSIGRSILGRALGRATNEVTGEMGLVGTFVPRSDVANELTNAIACRLDPDEQRKAADATLEVTRQDEVGATSTWTSETRPGVRGSSTVASRSESADGTTCMNVTDVIIVDGEETRETKRMCRAPGSSRYVLAA